MSLTLDYVEVRGELLQCKDEDDPNTQGLRGSQVLCASAAICV